MADRAIGVDGIEDECTDVETGRNDRMKELPNDSGDTGSGKVL